MNHTTLLKLTYIPINHIIIYYVDGKIALHYINIYYNTYIMSTHFRNKILTQYLLKLKLLSFVDTFFF